MVGAGERKAWLRDGMGTFAEILASLCSQPQQAPEGGMSHSPPANLGMDPRLTRQGQPQGWRRAGFC